MKTLALEAFQTTTSLLFWLFALPFAAVAFPALAVADKLSHLFRTELSLPAKQLSPRAA